MGFTYPVLFPARAQQSIIDRSMLQLKGLEEQDVVILQQEWPKLETTSSPAGMQPHKSCPGFESQGVKLSCRIVDQNGWPPSGARLPGVICQHTCFRISSELYLGLLSETA